MSSRHSGFRKQGLLQRHRRVMAGDARDRNMQRKIATRRRNARHDARADQDLTAWEALTAWLLGLYDRLRHRKLKLMR